MNIPPMDLGLSSIIYRKEETYEFPKIRRNGKPFKGRHKVKEKEVMQVSVSGLLAMTGITAYGFATAYFYHRGPGISAAVMALGNWFFSWIEKLLAQLAAIGSEMMPQWPSIPGMPQTSDFTGWLDGALEMAGAGYQIAAQFLK